MKLEGFRLRLSGCGASGIPGFWVHRACGDSGPGTPRFKMPMRLEVARSLKLPGTQNLKSKLQTSNPVYCLLSSCSEVRMRPAAVGRTWRRRHRMARKAKLRWLLLGFRV